MQIPNWHTIWIIGAGRFGQLAARRICAARPRSSVTLVDPDPVQSNDLDRRRVRQVRKDGIQFLVERLDGNSDPDWILPAAPVHVAYEWIRSKLSSRYAIEPEALPPSASGRLPNPQPAGMGTLYASNADWICPDDCPEPAKYCTVTGEAHTHILYRELQALRCNGFESVVIRSCQLLPGVGGYTPQALYDALDTVQAAKKSVLLSTACRCHGVLNAFRLKPLES